MTKLSIKIKAQKKSVVISDYAINSQIEILEEIFKHHVPNKEGFNWDEIHTICFYGTKKDSPKKIEKKNNVRIVEGKK